MQQHFTAAAIVTTQLLDWFNTVKPALEFRRTLHYTQCLVFICLVLLKTKNEGLEHTSNRA